MKFTEVRKTLMSQRVNKPLNMFSGKLHLVKVILRDAPISVPVSSIGTDTGGTHKIPAGTTTPIRDVHMKMTILSNLYCSETFIFCSRKTYWGILFK